MYRLLLVEDERWVRIALKKTLEKVNLPIQVVGELSHGLEAIDWLKTNQADLVITDIRMPFMDGINLLEMLQEHSSHPDVMIISGYDDFSYAQRAVRLNAVDYLLKPVEAGELKSSLQKWLDRRGAFSMKEGEAVRGELSPVGQILSYIESAGDVHMSLAEAAERVHLNPSYFCKLFKQTTGMNYKEYVAGLRMKEAERLLDTTSLRVCEIAERLGYRDQAYFSNQFKKRTGMNPTEYRKKRELIKHM
ncbi:response regulator [Marinicrinis lubricantis]|uniref:Response regulator n=1 Tax=Marinicrinis lubricantis TaxID=2086470 RepID=A0ABW1IS71_9BACL